jgi:hypothetical protein
MPDAVPFNAYDDEAALEAVLAFLDQPPLYGSAEDRLFGRLLRQVNDAAAAPMESPEEASLVLSDDLMRRLADLERRRAVDGHPFGDHPEGLGPTLGMDVSHC